MVIDQGLDTGAIIAQAPLTIEPTDTNQTLTAKLIDISDGLINTLLPSYIDNTIVAIPQTDLVITYSKKLTKTDGILDFNKPASVLEREIHAYNGWPKSRTTLGSVDVIVTNAIAIKDTHNPGHIYITDDKKLLIGTKVGSLQITELMPLGKQKMNVTAFLNGYASRIL
jgi:methionyl-tRNA formyltransferase